MVVQELAVLWRNPLDRAHQIPSAAVSIHKVTLLLSECTKPVQSLHAIQALHFMHLWLKPLLIIATCRSRPFTECSVFIYFIPQFGR